MPKLPGFEKALRSDDLITTIGKFSFHCLCSTAGKRSGSAAEWTGVKHMNPGLKLELLLGSSGSGSNETLPLWRPVI